MKENDFVKFSYLFDVKYKTSVYQLGSSKKKCKSIRKINISWSIIQKQKVYSKINARLKIYMYYWVLQYPKVMQSPIENYFMKVYIDCHNKKRYSWAVISSVCQVTPEQHGDSTIMGWCERSKGLKNNIIIGNSVLRYTFKPQSKKVSVCQKVMCGCKCCISSIGMHSYLLKWRDYHLIKLKEQSCNGQNRRSGEMKNIETYRNTVVLYGSHIQKTATYISMVMLCHFP